MMQQRNPLDNSPFFEYLFHFHVQDKRVRIIGGQGSGGVRARLGPTYFSEAYV